MARLLFIILLLPANLLAEDIAIPDRDIIAAYPLNEPIENLGETYAHEIPTSRSILINGNHQHFGVKLLPHHLQRIPRSELTWMTYDKTAHQVIVSATAKYHYFFGALLQKHHGFSTLQQTCAIYEVPTGQAKTLTASPYPDLTELPSPIIKTSSQTRSSVINIVEQRHDNWHLYIEWDCGFSETLLKTGTHINLTLTRFGRSREVIVRRFIHEPLVPFVIAMGPTVTRPDHTLIAVISVNPVTANNQPLIKGRICENPSDYLVFAFGRFGKPMSTIDPEGVEVLVYRVPPDFLPQEEGDNTQPVIMDEVQGTLLENIPLVDAAPYLKSRGVPFKDGDFAVYDPEQSKLHLRYIDDSSMELAKQLLTYFDTRHGNHPRMIRCNLTTLSMHPDPNHPLKETHHFYSIPSDFGAPDRLRVIEDDVVITDIEVDASANDQEDIRLSLPCHFPITKDRQSTFRMSDTELVLPSGKPLMIDTGLDDEDGSNLCLEISAHQFYAELPSPE